MCPPAQPPPLAEIDLYWSDEQITLFLVEYTPGSRLPDNVLALADSSPYQYPPSNLPEGFWFLVHSDEKKEFVHGFWNAKGEASKIYSNSTVSCWRTTLEYFEGQVPHGQRTDWLMQEYMITQNKCDKDEPKESRLLCRVFLSNENSSKIEMQPQNCKTITESEKINSVASIKLNISITCGQDSGSEAKEKKCEAGAFSEVADDEPNSSPQDLSDLECLLRGDYLELNDLEDPESHSSSSQNSSCPSYLSDEYFDSSAFLRDLEEEENNYMQGQRSISRYSFTTSIRPNDVVLQPATSGSLSSGCVKSEVADDLGTSSEIHEKLTEERVQEQTVKRHNPESRTEGSSSFSDVGTASNNQKNAAPSEEKKAGSSKMKKFKTYFCFALF